MTHHHLFSDAPYEEYTIHPFLTTKLAMEKYLLPQSPALKAVHHEFH